jgi:hypothetical protein
MFSEINLFNDAYGLNHFLFILNWEVKIEFGVSKREKEREREKQIKRVGGRV